MTTARFTQQARGALVPMRKAMLDACLLTLLTVVCHTFFSTPATPPEKCHLYPDGLSKDIFPVCHTFFSTPATPPFVFGLVLVLVFALVYAIAVVLRLRRAATNAPAAQSEWQVPLSCLNSRPLG